MCLLRGTDWVFKYNSGLNKNPPSAHRVYLCVLCGSEKKQRLFPYTALTDWFHNRVGVCLLRGTDWVFKCISGLNKNLRSVHTVYLCVLCGSEKKQRLFPYTTLTDWLLYGVCLLRGTDCVFKYNPGLNKNLRSAHTLYLCVFCGSQNKQRLFPYTALIDWFL